MLQSILLVSRDQNIGLSTVGLTELAHGLHRAHSPQRRQIRGAFLDDLLRDVPVFPYTTAAALLAGRISGEQQSIGITVPFADLLIGATALSIGFSVLTTNSHDFQLIPGLQVIPFR